MSRSSKKLSVARIWRWQRRIVLGQQEIWIARLQAMDGLAWSLTEQVSRSRLLLAAYPQSRVEAEALATKWGGQVLNEKADAWIKTSASSPLRIGKKFIIVDERAPARGEAADLPCLHIPHGMAFGSGEHATTFMLLRALASYDLKEKSVLDLGTGSGVLALAARLLDAGKIVATDFDAVAVRTARQNELLNYASQQIRWSQADVKKLKAKSRYDLVLGNLFSSILVEAAPQISECVTPEGQLWLSGILRSQEKEVSAAYRWQKMKLLRTVSRGKWIMQQWHWSNFDEGGRT
jgi:ribosomal protein L11 methyltransferase